MCCIAVATTSSGGEKGMLDLYATYILNAASSLLAFAVAIIGFRSEKKLKDNGWPTKKGYMLGLFFALMCASQISVQLIQSNRVRDAENQRDRIRAIAVGAYTGWIKAGQWSQKQQVWVKLVDARMRGFAPEDIQRDKVLNIGAAGVHFVNVRPNPPDVCNPERKWFDDPKHKKNELPKDMKVEVRDVRPLECTDKDQLDVWAFVSPLLE